VNTVRDIHPEYSISTAPVLLEFTGEEFKNTYKGAHDASYYRGLIDNAVYVAKAEKEGRKVKQVTVYTTPTCSWCTTLKSYLNKNQVRYTEVDVSKNETAAREMVSRSGQQGVPQTLIGGEMIVGFDKARINRLLEIQG
jgi:glutaredoxin-like YruB-family protein